jgi:predicted ArsR family transcriptional regulator
VPAVEELLPAGQARVLAVLRGAPAPMTLAELSDQTGLHVNTLRQHLDALLTRGEVSRSSGPAHGRGRPAWRYAALGPDSAPAGELADLAVALAGAVSRSSDDPTTQANLAGRDWGTRLAEQVVGDPGKRPDGRPDGRTATLAVMRRMGFAPEYDEDTRGRTVRLTRCPLLVAARAEPDIVCGVHLGLVQGLLEGLGESSAGSDLIPFAEPGACRLVFPPEDGPVEPPEAAR